MRALSENSLPWEVLCTEEARSALDNTRMPHTIRLKAVETILRLGAAEWNAKEREPLKGTPPGLHLYSSNITHSARVIWQVDQEFSERQNTPLADREKGHGTKSIFTDVIRIWRVCFDHDDVCAACLTFDKDTTPR